MGLMGMLFGKVQLEKLEFTVPHGEISEIRSYVLECIENGKKTVKIKEGAWGATAGDVHKDNYNNNMFEYETYMMKDGSESFYVYCHGVTGGPKQIVVKALMKASSAIALQKDLKVIKDDLCKKFK